MTWTNILSRHQWYMSTWHMIHIHAYDFIHIHQQDFIIHSLYINILNFLNIHSWNLDDFNVNKLWMTYISLMKYKYKWYSL